MSRRTAFAVCVLALAGAGVLLGACNPDGGERPLQYEPGVYKGKPDTPLGAEQLRALRARAAYQGDVSVASGAPGAGGGAREADVRVPGDALRARGSHQGGGTVSRGGTATPAVGASPGTLRGRTTLQGGGSVRPPGQ